MGNGKESERGSEGAAGHEEAERENRRIDGGRQPRASERAPR